MTKKKYEIKHHKDFHSIQLQGLRIKERSIFMALCYKAMEQESNLLEFDVNDLAKMINYTQATGDNIYKYLRKTYKSLKDITIEIDKENGYKDFVLFTTFETFEDKGIVQFKVNEDYRYLLNQVVAPYTIQNLLEYNQLGSKYSQLIYSLLRQWNQSKKIELTIENFRQKLSIEKFTMCNIDKRVFKPILEELSPYFHNLKIEKRKTGRKITHIKFTWQEKEKKTKSLINNVEQKQKVDTPIMNEVRTCIEKYPLACAGHVEDETNKRCQQARRYIGIK